MPQNPTRQVHALLGNLPTRTLAEKRRQRQHDKILHATLIFTRAKKRNLPKRLLKKTLLIKPERRFWRSQHKPKTRTPTKPRIFYKLNLLELLQKKDKPILKTLPSEKTT